MGWFSFSKYIQYYNLRKILKKIPALDSAEREYIMGLFAQYRSGGITKTEVEKVIRDLKQNRYDKIDSYEIDKIEEKLLEYFD